MKAEPTRGACREVGGTPRAPRAGAVQARARPQTLPRGGKAALPLAACAHLYPGAVAGRPLPGSGAAQRGEP